MSHDLSLSQGSSLRPMRRLPVGAEVQPKGGVHFRVWAPAARDVVVEFADHRRPLAPEPGERMTKEHSGGGYFSGWVDEAGAGMRYRFRLDSSSTALPDPASRAQPDGPHGDSVVVDPAAFAWNDGAWRGVPATQLVIYEMHIGTFTPEGSWAAATARLPALAELGVTCIEMMPVAEFSGCFGWGYDGVDLFAPTRLYGEPDDLRRFVDRAHGLGLAVILDVVYNHMGPDGNYLRSFAPAYFTDRYVTEWGEALNFDGPDAGPVREFFVANAGYWIDEYHFDGLRLDATHRICDASDEHVLAAIARRVRAAANGRSTFVVAENEDQVARLVRSREQGGYGLDAVWNDDFHHAARVALTGRREGYYRDFSGRPGEFVALAKHGFLFQGQRPTPEVPPRGTPSRDLPPSAFVVCLENHDQIAHSGAGRRGHQLSHPGSWRALTAFLLLNSAIPMLFQGQEFGASAPFLYFADYPSELGGLITKGRREFLAQFASLASPEMQAALADPVAPETFRRCVLDHDERRCERHAEMVALHRDLLALRRDDSAFRGRANRIDGAVLSDDAWLLRYFADDGSDRLLIFNIGRDLLLDPPSEPLLAPVAGGGWHLRWSSEAPRYGGTGIPEPIIDGVWRIAGHAAVLLTAKMPVS